jgi:hypothetical protein
MSVDVITQVRMDGIRVIIEIIEGNYINTYYRKHNNGIR